MVAVEELYRTTTNINYMKTPLKIAIIGISGNVGKRIAEEALNRGHQVMGIARNIDDVAARKNLSLKVGYINNPEALAGVLKGNDLVVSSVKPTDFDPGQLIQAVRLSGVKRWLAVGGAGSLEVSPGVTLLDTGKLPDPVVAAARGAQDFLNILRSVEDLDWTVLSPAVEFSAGERTGKFRLGNDQLIIDEKGKSAISFEDYAVALLDEIEEPHHTKGRFSIGY
jgi:putative NADH-flavin reductase